MARLKGASRALLRHGRGVGTAIVRGRGHWLAISGGPAPAGIAVSKDVWMLGIGLALVADAVVGAASGE